MVALVDDGFLVDAIFRLVLSFSFWKSVFFLNLRGFGGEVPHLEETNLFQGFIRCVLYLQFGPVFCPNFGGNFRVSWIHPKGGAEFTQKLANHVRTVDASEFQKRSSDPVGNFYGLLYTPQQKPCAVCRNSSLFGCFHFRGTDCWTSWKWSTFAGLGWAVGILHGAKVWGLESLKVYSIDLKHKGREENGEKVHVVNSFFFGVLPGWGLTASLKGWTKSWPHMKWTTDVFFLGGAVFQHHGEECHAWLQVQMLKKNKPWILSIYLTSNMDSWLFTTFVSTNLFFRCSTTIY